MDVTVMMVPRCNALTKSTSDISSVSTELEITSVHSLPNDVEVVDVIVALRGFSSAACAPPEKMNGSDTLDWRRKCTDFCAIRNATHKVTRSEVLPTSRVFR